MLRVPYEFDVAAAVGGPLIVVKFPDGRQVSAALGDRHFIRQMLETDQKLLRLYENAINALGSAYNVFARRKMDEDQGETFLSVGPPHRARKDVRSKRWIFEAKDEVKLLLDDLQASGFDPIVFGDLKHRRYGVQILVPFHSVEGAVRAYQIIDRAAQASPKQWAW